MWYANLSTKIPLLELSDSGKDVVINAILMER
jgi:hypothetical protein